MRHQPEFEAVGADPSRPFFHLYKQFLPYSSARIGFQDTDHDGDRHAMPIRFSPDGAEESDQTLLIRSQEDHRVRLV